MKKFKRPTRPGGGHRPRPQGGPPKRDAQPKGRVVVGIHAVREVLKVRPRAVSALWIRDRFQDHPDLVELEQMARRAGCKIEAHAPGALDKITGANQGVVAFANEQPEIKWTEILNRPRSVLIALDEVEDPHNLGAILRTAWLMGADGVLTPEHRSASLSPAVSKVAQGAVEHIPLESDHALPNRLKELKDHDYWILGLSHEAKQSLTDHKIPEKVVWVLGGESSGLRKSVASVCDELISIPQSDPGASYNVSIAAAVAMFETFRQQRQ
ncbi:MAG: 23S rRNA (guanosine(2251)-2'-O)-methyltransferase RlmB [Bdellovibrionales bacterium]